MLLEIITPESKLFTGEITSVKLPGMDGEFEILNNHAPIISTLSKGVIRITDNDNNTEKFEVNGGVIEMQNNKIIVLAD
ncbi:MAG: ATP synthase F1 subunit epsilon [Flavobacteriales bacterium]|nr:ATP synthase F1 subunit epsilon [Flavobacteriales bacterium]